MAGKGKKREGKGLLFLGVLAGAVIGAAVALVYSPSTGDENREKIVEYVSEKTGMA